MQNSWPWHHWVQNYKLPSLWLKNWTLILYTKSIQTNFAKVVSTFLLALSNWSLLLPPTLHQTVFYVIKFSLILLIKHRTEYSIPSFVFTLKLLIFHQYSTEQSIMSSWKSSWFSTEQSVICLGVMIHILSPDNINALITCYVIHNLITYIFCKESHPFDIYTRISCLLFLSTLFQWKSIHPLHKILL